jgi:lipoprotein NlpD
MQIFSVSRGTAPHTPLNRAALILSVALATAMLASCASKSRAPIEDRSAGTARSSASHSPSSGSNGPVVPRSALDPSLSTYTVQRGDTLFRIALDSGQAWRDVVLWNNLEDPNKLEVGQVLRVKPPESVAQSLPVKPGSVDVKASGVPAPVLATPSTPAVAGPAPAKTAAPVAVNPVGGTASNEDEVVFSWPVIGAILEPFSESKNKGVDIAGKLGDPVFAAAEGTVVYAGSGLRGYGNLIILKHNNTYLTAYAHNQSLAVKEQQVVKKGQRIAQMGQSDADRVKLHFEVRRQGKPIDPIKMLPEKQ